MDSLSQIERELRLHELFGEDPCHIVARKRHIGRQRSGGEVNPERSPRLYPALHPAIRSLVLDSHSEEVCNNRTGYRQQEPLGQFCIPGIGHRVR